MDKEVWKNIKLYRGLYKVSNCGRVKSLARKGHPKEKILDAKRNKVFLSHNGYSTYYSIDELVAQAFVPNPNRYYRIRHKDGWKENNSSDNLEWY